MNKKNIPYKKLKKIIQKSGLFDKIFYLKVYPDVRKSDMLPLEHYVKYGIDEDRKPNEFFDPVWYREYYKDVKADGGYPFVHFILYGRYEHRLASRSEYAEYQKLKDIFDINFYKNAYEDLKKQEKEFDFVLHFIRYGKKEGRKYRLLQNRKQPTTQSIDNVKPLKQFQQEKEQYLTDMIAYHGTLKVAIALHVYYLDKVQEILDYLKNITHQYFLYITIATEKRSKLESILKSNDFSDYTIVEVENYGYDIVPFLSLLPLLKEQKYDVVCKLHTKKGAANLEKHIDGIDNIWFKLLMDSVLGTKESVNQILGAFEKNETLGMLGSAALYKSTQKLMYNNEVYVTKILNTLENTTDPANDWGFFAGSIFWARVDIFDSLIDNQKIDTLLQSSSQMKTGAVASVFHAFERVFGVLPELKDMKTGLLYHTDFENKESAIQIVEDYTTVFNPLGIGIVLHNEFELKKNYQIAKRSRYFDAKFYKQHSRFCKNVAKIDPLLYFLRYGVYFNESPSRALSPFHFWSNNKTFLVNRVNPLIALSQQKSSSQILLLPPNHEVDSAIKEIKKSKLFDKSYYLKEYQDVANSGMDPLIHYCKFGYKEGRTVSTQFDVHWYTMEYLGDYLGSVNPLFHYLIVGRKKGFLPKPRYKEGQWITQETKENPKRITLFASYDKDGIIDESVIDFVKELSRHSDVYFLCDNEASKEQLDKLQAYTKGAWALRHGEYDFGSYKRLAQYYVGWETIEAYDELILANDSSYLLRSLNDVFTKMSANSCSWWGMQATKGMYSTKDIESNRFTQKIPIDYVKSAFLKQYAKDEIYDFHIGSYFLVYKKCVLEKGEIQKVLKSVTKEKSKKNIILKYEIGLTQRLIYKHFDFNTYMDHLYPFHPIYTNYIFDMIRDGFPLFKRFFLTENHYHVQELWRWEEKLLEILPNLNLEPIKKNLYRVADAEKLYKNLHLTDDFKEPLSIEAFQEEDKKSVVDNSIWIFPVCAFTHRLDDNTRALFEAVKEDESITKVILFRKKHVAFEGKNVILLPLHSYEAQHYLLKSKYLFIKHTPSANIIYPLDANKHKFIALWHGIPLKRIGMASLDLESKHEHIMKIHSQFYSVIASSAIDRLAMSAAFYPLKYQDVWVTGLPRHDFILKETSTLPLDLRNEMDRLEAILGDKKFILYAPTFRNDQENGYYPFNEEEKARLYELLEKHNIILGIREHMADKKHSYSSALRHSNIIDVSSDNFQNIEILYRKADMLITDYSSCFIDYMITGKPMVSFAYDYEHYINQERGLFYDMEFVFPGKICKDFDTLYKELNQLIENNYRSLDTAYNFKQKIFFDNFDSNNAKRLVDILIEHT